MVCRFLCFPCSIVMELMIFVFLGCLLSVVNCDNYTITDEVWFDIEIRDFDGPGDDYRGRFVIGLFGETVPMTALNFASIAKGYERQVIGVRELWDFVML